MAATCKNAEKARVRASKTFLIPGFRVNKGIEVKLEKADFAI